MRVYPVWSLLFHDLLVETLKRNKVCDYYRFQKNGMTSYNYSFIALSNHENQLINNQIEIDYKPLVKELEETYNNADIIDGNTITEIIDRLIVNTNIKTIEAFNNNIADHYSSKEIDLNSRVFLNYALPEYSLYIFVKLAEHEVSSQLSKFNIYFDFKENTILNDNIDLIYIFDYKENNTIIDTIEIKIPNDKHYNTNDLYCILKNSFTEYLSGQEKG